jgi:HEPN domain-containing protein
MKDIEKLINYWFETAKHDKKVVSGLMKTRNYAEALFFGHLVLEKILKGLVVKGTGKTAPLIHDLIRLYNMSKLNKLHEEDIDFLGKVNDFNLASRYPDYKMEFYKRSTKTFTEENIKKINLLYRILCKEYRK